MMYSIAKLSVFCILLLAFSACTEMSQPIEAPSFVVPPMDEAAEMALMADLSASFIQNPTTRPEVEQNLILEYAISNMLPIKTTESGISYVILKEGKGDFITPERPLSVHYQGMLLDGKPFDNSYKRGKPIQFRIGEMIEGWNEGLQLLQPSAKAIFLIPSHLGYGPYGMVQGSDTIIPPYAPLRFDLEILE